MENMATSGPAGTFSCLIVDDSKFARLNAAKTVARIGGWVVGEASNGREALGLYRDLGPDLVLLDITMPEVDGVQALREILKEDGEAKVIIVSSLGHKEMVWRAIGLGAKHFITKPFNPDHAGTVIRSVVEGE